MSSLSRLLLVLTLLVAAYGIALPTVPLAIRFLAPPVSDFEIVDARALPDGRVRLTAHVVKHRCVFTALRFSWRDPAGEVWRVGYLATDQPGDTDTDRPSGGQTLGPWTIAAPPVSAATFLDIAVRHRCGPFAVVTPLATLDRATLPPEDRRR